MEAKILNFTDAMKLSQILLRYIDPSHDFEKTALNFIDELVNKIQPMDYLECVELFVGKLDKNNLPTGKELVDIIYTGMRNNNVPSLLSVYKKLGFV